MIPVYELILEKRDLEYATECLRTGWISSAGHYIQAFEEAWAAYCGMKFGVAVSNGTAALQLAVRYLELEPDDEVIIPTFTIISCAQAIVSNGGIPVLVDSDPRTWCLDVSQVEAKITRRTRAIMPVHVYGHPVDMDPLRALADREGLIIIEDAAEAHGAQYLAHRHSPNPAWHCCGGMGDFSIFSFYANKPITTGEGGMILCNDAEVAERLRSLRNLCFRSERRFSHVELGYNFRMTNIQAALGLGQFERVHEIVARKRLIGQNYNERLKTLPLLQLPVEEPWAKQIYWMYGVVLHEDTGLDAAGFARRLANLGIETRPFFLGMHEQPVFLARGWYRDEHYPVAERLARQGLYLPSGLHLNTPQIDQVCDAVQQALR